MPRPMKHSGVEWLGDIPADWDIVKTKHFYSNQKEIAGKFADNYQRLALTLNGVIKRSKDDSKGLQPEAFNSYQILRENELVFKLIDLANVATSRVGYSPYTGIVSPAYIVLRPRKASESKFGEYYFLSMWQREVFNHLGDDGVRSSLNASDLLNLPYIFAHDDEKKRIAAFLDDKCARIDSVIEKTRTSVEEYKKLKQALITRAVTKGIRPNRPMKQSGVEWLGDIPSDWKIIKLKYVADLQPSCDTAKLTDESEITYTPMECIKNGYFINNTATYGKVSASLTPYSEGDIVMAKVTPCFENGNIAVMENLASGFGLGSSELFVFRAHSIATRYLFYWLQNDLFMQQGCATMTGTGGLKRVSAYFVRNSLVLFPPLDEQKEIANYLDEKIAAIDSLVAKKNRLAEELTSLKKSLIFEYVTGKKEVPT